MSTSLGRLEGRGPVPGVSGSSAGGRWRLQRALPLVPAFSGRLDKMYRMIGCCRQFWRQTPRTLSAETRSHESPSPSTLSSKQPTHLRRPRQRRLGHRHRHSAGPGPGSPGPPLERPRILRSAVSGKCARTCGCSRECRFPRPSSSRTTQCGRSKEPTAGSPRSRQPTCGRRQPASARSTQPAYPWSV